MSTPLQPDEYVGRPEFEAVIDSLNRELSGLTVAQTQTLTKLDQLLSGRLDEATKMGSLTEKVQRLSEDVKAQGETIQRMEREANKNQIAPRDQAIKIAIDIIKLLGALLLGYWLKR